MSFATYVGNITHQYNTPGVKAISLYNAALCPTAIGDLILVHVGGEFLVSSLPTTPPYTSISVAAGSPNHFTVHWSASASVTLGDTHHFGGFTTSQYNGDFVVSTIISATQTEYSSGATLFTALAAPEAGSSIALKTYELQMLTAGFLPITTTDGVEDPNYVDYVTKAVNVTGSAFTTDYWTNGAWYKFATADDIALGGSISIGNLYTGNARSAFANVVAFRCSNPANLLELSTPHSFRHDNGEPIPFSAIDPLPTSDGTIVMLGNVGDGVQTAPSGWSLIYARTFSGVTAHPKAFSKNITYGVTPYVMPASAGRAAAILSFVLYDTPPPPDPPPDPGWYRTGSGGIGGISGWT